MNKNTSSTLQYVSLLYRQIRKLACTRCITEYDQVTTILQYCITTFMHSWVFTTASTWYRLIRDCWGFHHKNSDLVKFCFEAPRDPGDSIQIFKFQVRRKSHHQGFKCAIHLWLQAHCKYPFFSYSLKANKTRVLQTWLLGTKAFAQAFSIFKNDVDVITIIIIIVIVIVLSLHY